MLRTWRKYDEDGYPEWVLVLEDQDPRSMGPVQEGVPILSWQELVEAVEARLKAAREAKP